MTTKKTKPSKREQERRARIRAGARVGAVMSTIDNEIPQRERVIRTALASVLAFRREQGRRDDGTLPPDEGALSIESLGRRLAEGILAQEMLRVAEERHGLLLDEVEREQGKRKRKPRR